VLVAIRATTVNPTDLSTRDGSRRRRFPELEPPFVLGWDLAGEVLRMGDGVSAYRPGDRVVGVIPFVQIGGRVGAYAELAAVDPEWLAPLPDGVPFEEAATLPLNALTARQALDLLGLAAGPEPDRALRFETILVRPDAAMLSGLTEQLAAGRLRTRVAQALPLEAAARGHELAEAGALRGKVVLVPEGR
jgi:NADPH2:quinone reductase